MQRSPWGLNWRRVALAAMILMTVMTGLSGANQETSEEAMPPLPAADGLASEPLSAVTPREELVSSEEPAAEEALEGGVLVSMEFQNALLKDVLKAFSQQTGLNVVAEAEVGEKEVTLYLEEVAALDALEQILRTYQLTYERPVGSDIYIVKAVPAVEASSAPQTITRLYQLKYARVSKSVLAKAAAAFGARTPFEGGSISVGTGGGQGGGASSGTSPIGGGAGAGAAASVGIDVIIKALLTEQGSVVVDERTNSLLITDLPDNFPRLEGALAALDVRTPQILVEAEVLETSLNKVKDLGIEWGTKGDLFTLIPGSRKTRFPFNWIGHGDAPTHASADQFSLSTLDASSAKAVLSALQTDTDTKILARPKVLTLDNESAIIRLTANEAIGFATAAQATTGSTTSEPEREITGVILVVTPQTNADGYITMLVEPSVTKTVASKISPPSGQATPRDTKTRSTRTLVRLRSGDTFVVGGLIDRSEEEAVDRVPLLGDIPIIGEAFKNTEINNSVSELIVFVTPRVLEEPAVTHVASASRAWLSEPREQEPAGGGQPPTLDDAMDQALDAAEH